MFFRKTMEFVKAIKISMQNMLDALPWINSANETQLAARYQRENMYTTIAFPAISFNTTKLDEFYRSLIFDPDDDLFTMKRKISIFMSHFEKLLSKKIIRVEAGSSYQVNAFYSEDVRSFIFDKSLL